MLTDQALTKDWLNYTLTSSTDQTTLTANSLHNTVADCSCLNDWPVACGAGDARRHKISPMRPFVKGWVSLTLNIRLKSYVYRQHLYTIIYVNDSTTNLPLEVSHKKLCCRLYSITLEFCSQNRQIRFVEPPFAGVRGNVHTSYIARWKARGWLSIRDNWTFFTNSYGWVAISRYWSKSAIFKEGHFKRKFQVKGDVDPEPLSIYQKTRVITLSCHNISAVCSFVSTQSTHVIDRRTDALTELRSLRPR